MAVVHCPVDNTFSEAWVRVAAFVAGPKELTPADPVTLRTGRAPVRNPAGVNSHYTLCSGAVIVSEEKPRRSGGQV